MNKTVFGFQLAYFRRAANLTQEELTAILEMYKMVSFKVLCDVFGIKVSIPKFN